jgi:hypothetical protein
MGYNLVTNMRRKKNTKVARMRRISSPERRVWQRLPLAIPVFVHGIDETGQKFVEFATAMNISAGGAQLAIRRHLSPRTRISLEIPCSVGPYRVVHTQIRSTLPARILNRTMASSEPFHLLGLKFSRPLIQGSAKRMLDGDGTPRRRKTTSTK